MFEGNLMEHLNQITDEQTCQLACQHVPGCTYYIFDNTDKDCQLLDSDSRQCDLIKVEKRDSGDFDTTCLPPDASTPSPAKTSTPTTSKSTTTPKP